MEFISFAQIQVPSFPPRIRKRFSKDSTEPKIMREEGSGIGLSITKQFIELHQGKIWCDSSEETGVEFHIVIPLIKAKGAGPTLVN